MREKVDLKAVTIKEISGAAIKTIPVGTEFTVTYWDSSGKTGWGCGWSVCSGLEVSDIWNDEFKFIDEA